MEVQSRDPTNRPGASPPLRLSTNYGGTHRRGMVVNHKRVARITREDNLLAMQPRFVVTTNSNHKLDIYLNLASRMKLTGINQLWVADITYIRLKAEFVYLAVILDGSRGKWWGGEWSERSPPD